MKIAILISFILGLGYIYFTSSYYSENVDGSIQIGKSNVVTNKEIIEVGNESLPIKKESLGRIVKFEGKEISETPKNNQRLVKKTALVNDSLDPFKNNNQRIDSSFYDGVPDNYPGEFDSNVEDYQEEGLLIGEFISVEPPEALVEYNNIMPLSIDNTQESDLDEIPMETIEVTEVEHHIGEFVKVNEELYEESINTVKEIGEFIPVDSRDGMVVF